MVFFLADLVGRGKGNDILSGNEVSVDVRLVTPTDFILALGRLQD